MKDEIPENIKTAVECFLHSVNKEEFVVIGVVFRAEPPCLVLVRNTPDDPAELMRFAADVIEEKTEQGAVIAEKMSSIN